MSFPSERIEQYLLSRAAKGVPQTSVPFAMVKAGGVEIVIISDELERNKDNSVREEELARHLAKDGIIRLPQRDKQTVKSFKRIDVGGKPISEVIIEERR